VEAGYTRMENSTHIAYTTEYYIAEATVATWTRGLRMPSLVEVSVYLDGFQVLTGFLDTVKLTAGSRVFSMNESGLVEKLVFSNITETRLQNLTVYISDYMGFTTGIKSPSSEKPFRGVAFNRTLRMAEITVKAEPVEPLQPTEMHATQIAVEGGESEVSTSQPQAPLSGDAVAQPLAPGVLSRLERVFTVSDGRRYKAVFPSARELNLFDKVCREGYSIISVNLKDGVVECRLRGYTMRFTVRASSLGVLD
jgi:hypothetical protein